MKKLVLLFASVVIFCSAARAQNSYDIKINMKGCKDSMAYLLKYVFDQTYIVDTCKSIKDGKIQFKGKGDLEKGVHILVNQDKAPYFEFLVNENQKFTITTDASNMIKNLTVVGNKENEQLFTYMKFGVSKNEEFNKTREQTKGKSKADSTKIMTEKINQLNEEVKKYDSDFMQLVKGTFLYDYMNLKTEKVAKDIPKAKNGRPDSIYQYYYYKNHYFDGVDFKDDRIVRTPSFDDRIKKYFESVIVINPDTVIQEIDKLLEKCNEDNLAYRALIGYFAYSYEQSKLVGFDKVFVHLADKYIIPGKVKVIYSDEVVKNIKSSVDIKRNLLIGKKVPDIFMIDTIYGKEVRKMGFDTTTTGKSIENLYYKNQAKLTSMFKTLYNVNAKYTVLVFWAADCGHCQTEMPKLHESLQELKGKVDVKVFAVQTKDELFDSWRKFIIEKKLTDFTHVYDGVRIGNLKERFDVTSTPMIYILDKDKKILVKKIAAEQAVDVIKRQETIEKQL